MEWTPRRILLHVIMILVTLGLPLVMPSSCSPVVHSGFNTLLREGGQWRVASAVNVREAALAK